jgi:hypothetical protein
VFGPTIDDGVLQKDGVLRFVMVGEADAQGNYPKFIRPQKSKQSPGPSVTLASVPVVVARPRQGNSNATIINEMSLTRPCVL